MITLQNITKIYGKKQNTFTALDDVSFTIPDGASVAIVGKSGSGKSTLMHIMSGLDVPQEGSVIVGGQSIFDLSQKKMDALRVHTIGFIFQSFFVQPNETVIDNVSLPLEVARIPKRERSTRIADALKAVELYDKRRNKAKDLSGGQKQRLAIARAIVNNPSIIFADEPTGNLDTETGARIEDLLFGYNRDHSATLILVTHDADLAAKCQYQVVMKDGRVLKHNLPAARK